MKLTPRDLIFGAINGAFIGVLAPFIFSNLGAKLPVPILVFIPALAKGAALGIYNTTQSLGLFLGGALGGALAKNSGSTTVWLLCALVAAVWLVLGLTMTMPVPRPRQPAA